MNSERLMRVAMFSLAFALVMIAIELSVEMQAIKRMKRVTVYIRETPPGEPGGAETVLDGVAEG